MLEYGFSLRGYSIIMFSQTEQNLNPPPLCSHLFDFGNASPGIQQSSLLIEMMIQKNLKSLERMEVLITSHVKVLLRNKYNSYSHTA